MNLFAALAALQQVTWRYCHDDDDCDDDDDDDDNDDDDDDDDDLDGTCDL